MKMKNMNKETTQSQKFRVNFELNMCLKAIVCLQSDALSFETQVGVFGTEFFHIVGILSDCFKRYLQLQSSSSM